MLTLTPRAQHSSADDDDRGLVNSFRPAIMHNGKMLHHSSVVSEYLDGHYSSFDHDEFLCGPECPHLRLLPTDPYVRSQVQLWVRFIDEKLVPLFYKVLVSSSSPVAHDNYKAQTVSAWLFFVEQGLSKDGPYFLGKRFSLVDTAIAPFVQRLMVLQSQCGLELPTTQAMLTLLPRKRRWAYNAVVEIYLARSPKRLFSSLSLFLCRQKQVVLHGFDAQLTSLTRLVNYCEVVLGRDSVVETKTSDSALAKHHLGSRC